MRTFLVLMLFLIPLPPVLSQITPFDAAALMQKGINLGNTLEPPLEGGWNNPPAQEYYFDLYKEAGFTTVRIPVRWDEHTADTSPFAIDESWMQRVEQIVDWGLSRDLFIIINAHHEDWIKQNYSNETIRARFDSIWSQIATHFSAKSEKLLFEIINEPYGLTRTENDDLHQRVLSIIRKTNPTRIVIFQGHNWGGSDELIAAAIPDDEYLMGSFHSYDPYLFGLEGQGTWGTTTDYNILENKFIAVNQWSETNHIPVLLGEFGSLRTCDYNSRMKHYRAYVEFAQKYGFIACAWDDGGDFRIMERATHKWDEVKDILINTNTFSPRNLSLKILDTLIQVSWVNSAAEIDHIVVEHRLSTGTWSAIDTLSGDTTSIIHLFPGYDRDHYYRIIGLKSTGERYYSQPMKVFMPRYEPKVRTPYLGYRLPIPGIIEIEDFDGGGEGLTYHDTSPSNTGNAYREDEAVDIFSKNESEFFLGGIYTGEWCDYSVTIAEDGLYKTDFYVAALLNGGTFRIAIDTILSRVITAKKTTNRLTTTILTDTMDLTAGDYILRLTILNDQSSSFNIDKIVFTRIEPVQTSAAENSSTVQLYAGNQKLYLNFTGNEHLLSVHLFNASGRLIRHIKHPENNSVISTGDLPPGIYLVSIATEQSTYTKKVSIY